MKLRFLYVLLPVIFYAYVAVPLHYARADYSDDMRRAIDEKAAALKELEEQRKELEKTLDGISASNNKLSGEIKYVDNTINQLNITVRSNELTVEKLELEMDSLRSDIDATEESIANKKQTIGKLFTEMQQRDNENLLVVFLKNQSLAEAVNEIQTLSNLNNNLFVNITELAAFQNELSGKVMEQESKRQSKEVESANLKNRQGILQDQKKVKQAILAETKNQEKVYERQIDELKKLQDEISTEIETIENELRKTIDPNLLPIPRAGVLLWPVPEGRLTQAYGRTTFAIKNYKSQYHNGIDIGRFLGAEIVAAEDGVVINSGNQDNYCRGGAYGKFAVIKHDNGLTTLYGHMSRYLVTVGERVKRGEVIGYMGRTGWATGAHLHFTVFASQTLSPARAGFPEGTQASRSCGPMPVGGDIDPMKYIEIPS
ncbi:hypothetical protein A3D55_01235 [Candidatus Jorgensenbacteria bacterium RIFCSPHIGHO2_02_FULL_45_20]|uniref:M23ase beta-sheet core domain-containing protein n=2 Tax=Candidatus Joergenseniibacteriota TaxID=1752739 RepID=A0A1F6BNA7_9BACT|nr:MAG: Peptidase M23 [Candidatus Jorgensenbacteria bacterium GW2011_GWA2_45_9]OGG38323.1 MAG: hypothetical protein A3D55_01235 [Candidatus Jorgensenbacteria bacterium RIFCSPHIGHO2_02_FULL_45_20]